MTYSLSLKVFKRYWNEMASSYAVTNNDAALMFRALTELILFPHVACCATAPMANMNSLSDRLEKLVACFPQELAPLCRELAKACIQELQHEIVATETVFQKRFPVKGLRSVSSESI